MADQTVGGTNAALSDTTVDQLLHGVAGGDGGQGGGEGTDHAHSHGLVVVSRSVGSLTIPTPALVGAAVSSDAPVVADISPSVGVHVEVLHVAHLGGAGILRSARSSGCVVDHNEGSGAVGQEGGGGSTSSPLGTGHNGGTG